jgi:hypothetical protein
MFGGGEGWTERGGREARGWRGGDESGKRGVKKRGTGLLEKRGRRKGRVG